MSTTLDSPCLAAGRAGPRQGPARYESWGWVKAGEMQPYDDSPPGGAMALVAP